MAYSNNINLPKARAIALKLVFYEQLPVSVVARKCGVHRATIWRWRQKWQDINRHVSFTNVNRPHRQPGSRFRLDSCKWLIPTLSSRPHSCPHALASTVVERILELRRTLRRCAEVIWHQLGLEGIKVSLSSVKRVLARHHCYDRKKYEKRLYRKNPKRPLATAPGQLVQVDTVHLINLACDSRVYAVTVIDLYTRMAYAKVFAKINQNSTVTAVLAAQSHFGFKFAMVQADNGPEFGKNFQERLEHRSITVRHSRPRRPNDNAHIERFNRTLRYECFGGRYSVWHTRPINQIQCKIEDFLDYYNNYRVHLGLQYRTPVGVLQRW
jgi:transposase InsO family protein